MTESDTWKLSLPPSNTDADCNLLCLNDGGPGSIFVCHFQVAPGST